MLTPARTAPGFRSSPRSYRNRRANCHVRMVVFKKADREFIPMLIVLTKRRVARGEEALLSYGRKGKGGYFSVGPANGQALHAHACPRQLQLGGPHASACMLACARVFDS
jgi:hypothetical protein